MVGICHSQGEWFDADMVADAKTKFNSSSFVMKKLIPQVDVLPLVLHAVLLAPHLLLLLVLLILLMLQDRSRTPSTLKLLIMLGLLMRGWAQRLGGG